MAIKRHNRRQGFGLVKRFLTISMAMQVLEKNHFLPSQNRATSSRMNEKDRKRGRILMLFLAVGLALAILAPVAVLAA
jgi:hypothetical protein